VICEQLRRLTRALIAVRKKLHYARQIFFAAACCIIMIELQQANHACAGWYPCESAMVRLAYPHNNHSKMRKHNFRSQRGQSRSTVRPLKVPHAVSYLTLDANAFDQRSSSCFRESSRLPGTLNVQPLVDAHKRPRTLHGNRSPSKPIADLSIKPIRNS